MPKKVLIVDDSLVSRMMIKEIILLRNPNWEFVQAASSEKAVDACQKSQFDYITIDLNMPGESGLEVSPKILESQERAKLALITANISPEVKQKAKELGVDYINKPINESEILSFIETPEA